MYNDEIDALLNRILEDEEEKKKRLGAANKQMLTQTQICQMIKDAGYSISETTIRTKIRENAISTESASSDSSMNMGNASNMISVK